MNEELEREMREALQRLQVPMPDVPATPRQADIEREMDAAGSLRQPGEDSRADVATDFETEDLLQSRPGATAPQASLRPEWRTDTDVDDAFGEDALPTSPAPSAGRALSNAASPDVTAAGAKTDKGAPAAGGRDYTGADIADAIRRPLRGIARGLAMASGHSLPSRPYEGERLRAEDRAAAQRQQALDAQGAEQSQRAQLAREQMVAQQAGRAEDREIRREGMQAADARSQAQLEQQRELAESDPRRALVNDELQRRRALREVDSEASNQVRFQLREQIQTLPPAMRRLYESRNLDEMNGEQLEVFAGPLLRRGIRGTGAGGGGPSLPSGQLRGLGENVDAESVIQEAVASGIPENTARVMAAQHGGLSRLASAIATAGRQVQGAELAAGRRAEAAEMAYDQGVEIAPGIVSHLRNPIGEVEARDIRSGLGEAASHGSALRQIDQIASRYGVSAPIDPRAEADLVGPIQAMMAMVATLRNTGVINPAEAPTIEAAIPNPQNLRQMSFGELQRRINSFRTLLSERISNRLHLVGVDDAGIRQATNFLRTGELRRGGAQQAPTPAARPNAPSHADEPAQPLTRPTAPAGDMVNVRTPDGRQWRIPRARLQDALSRGAVQQ